MTNNITPSDKAPRSLNFLNFFLDWAEDACEWTVKERIQSLDTMFEAFINSDIANEKVLRKRVFFDYEQMKSLLLRIDREQTSLIKELKSFIQKQKSNETTF